MSVFVGSQGDYRWIETMQSLQLGGLIGNCSQVLLGRYLAVATFDSGCLGINEEERQAGWVEEDGVAYSPPITSVQGLPWEQYDEWYLFGQRTTLGHFERFVNWGGFSLRDPQYLLGESDPTWDRVGIQCVVDQHRDLQDRFWDQLTRIRPETYIADGDHLIFVTIDSAAYSMVERWLGGREDVPQA